MIVVKVELWSARTGEVSELGRMYVANDGTSKGNRGNYSAAVCRRGTTEVPQARAIREDGPKPTRTGDVLNYPRHSYNVWRLITRALKACFPEEAK